MQLKGGRNVVEMRIKYGAMGEARVGAAQKVRTSPGTG